MFKHLINVIAKKKTSCSLQCRCSKVGADGAECDIAKIMLNAKERPSKIFARPKKILMSPRNILESTRTVNFSCASYCGHAKERPRNISARPRTFLARLARSRES